MIAMTIPADLTRPLAVVVAKEGKSTCHVILIVIVRIYLNNEFTLLIYNADIY